MTDDRFELLAQLGKGGIGVVWKARDRESGNIVALKLIHSQYAHDPKSVARFERQAEIAQLIDSPYVVKVLGFGRRDGVPYMAMEYVEGPSLQELLNEKGRLTWDEAKPILRQTTAGLAAAHAAGVLHRDLKPSNILIAADGTTKLAGFGVPSAVDTAWPTGRSTSPENHTYLAPDDEATAQSDLYSLGVVAYEVLTGAPPFDGEPTYDIVGKKRQTPVNIWALPADSRKLIGWLLERNPAQRPPSAAMVLLAIDGRIEPPAPWKPGRSANPRGRWAVFVSAGTIAWLYLLLRWAPSCGTDGRTDPSPGTAATLQAIFGTRQAVSTQAPTPPVTSTGNR